MPDPITLADVRAWIQRRVELWREVATATPGTIAWFQNDAVCMELTEILAMLDRVQPGGTEVSSLGQCPGCGSRSVTRSFPVDRPTYCTCDDCKRKWRPKRPC